MRRHWPFLFVLAFALASRFWFALTFPVAQISDYEAYYNEARAFAGLANGSISPINSIGPKLFFSVWFRIFGDGLRGIGVANTLLYCASLTMIYAAARRIFDPPTAALASIIGSFSLSELYFINLASSEVLGGFFIAAIYLVLSRGALTWRRAWTLGVVGGLALYNRSNILPMGALTLAHELLMATRLRPALAKAIVVQIITLLITVPLCFFNLSHFGRFTPLIANAEALWYGNNPKLSGDFHSYTKVPEELPLRSPERAALRREFSSFYETPDPELDFSKLNPYQIGDVKVRYALGWIAQNPKRYAELIWARFQFLFFSCTYGEVPFRSYDNKNPDQPLWSPAHLRLMDQARLPIRQLYQFLIGSAFLGLLVSVVWYRPWHFMASTKGTALLVIAYYSLPFLLSAAANRYHIPILGLAWVYLAHGVLLTARGIRSKSTTLVPLGNAPAA